MYEHLAVMFPENCSGHLWAVHYAGEVQHRPATFYYTMHYALCTMHCALCTMQVRFNTDLKHCIGYFKITFLKLGKFVNSSAISC